MAKKVFLLRSFRIKNILIVTSFLFLGLCSKCADNPNILEKNTIEKSQTTPGKILFITGSCSSGKSSMATILAKKLNAEYFAFDELVMPVILKRFIVNQYGKFLGFFINNIFARNFSTAVNLVSEKRKLKYQMRFYKDLREGLADEPTSRMYNNAKRVAQQGKDVIIESPIYLIGGVNFLSNLSIFDDMDVTYVLAYCPWNKLVDRIKERNKSKNKKTHREFNWALENFIHNFDAKNNTGDNNLLECLNGKDVHSIVHKYADLKYRKKRIYVVKEVKDDVLNVFNKKDDYYIYPKFKYNLVVNTKDYTPKMGAKSVLKYFRKK